MAQPAAGSGDKGDGGHTGVEMNGVSKVRLPTGGDNAKSGFGDPLSRGCGNGGEGAV